MKQPPTGHTPRHPHAPAEVFAELDANAMGIVSWVRARVAGVVAVDDTSTALDAFDALNGANLMMSTKYTSAGCFFPFYGSGGTSYSVHE